MRAKLTEKQLLTVSGTIVDKKKIKKQPKVGNHPINAPCLQKNFSRSAKASAHCHFTHFCFYVTMTLAFMSNRKIEKNWMKTNEIGFGYVKYLKKKTKTNEIGFIYVNIIKATVRFKKANIQCLLIKRSVSIHTDNKIVR